MKQTTIFNFLPKIREVENDKIPVDDKNIFSSNKTYTTKQIKSQLVRTYLQKNLSQLIEEQTEFESALRNLGKSWYKQKEGFGYTDSKKIMIFAKIQEFNANFFNLYEFNDFQLIRNAFIDIDDITKNKNEYVKISNIDYSINYVLKAVKVLGEDCRIFQHSKLKLIYIKNDKFAALICPKF